jgi:peptidyl-prolyl cis-trans isomerase SurA
VLPAALALAAAAPAEEVADGIAAQVGPDIVLMSEVVQLAAPVEKIARSQGATDADIETLRGEMLERLIERRLLEQVVKRAELEAGEPEVDQAIAAIAKENGLSSEQLRASVEAGGIPFGVYREKIRGEIQRAKVLNAMVRSKVRIDEREVRRLYDEKYAKMPDGGEEVHLRHLLVTFGKEVKRDEATACGQVRSALARIRAGESFEEVAARTSEVAPDRGGDVGWVQTSTLAGWMKDVVGKLGPGETSEVLRMPFGCNLLQVVERREFKKRPYAEVKDELADTLYEQRIEEEYTKFVTKLRGQTYIERKGLFASRGAKSPSLLTPAPPAPVSVPPRPGEFDEGLQRTP